ncbi:MAG TPA: energy transducer TonB [Gemmatirosa sp.]
MRILAPQRPIPVPYAGTFFSLTAHAALLAVAVGGSSVGRDHVPGEADGSAGGEQLHWIGVGDGTGTVRRSSGRPSARPPLAYVIPGHAGLRVSASVASGAPAGGAPSRGTRGHGQVPNERRDPTRLAADPAEPLLASSVQTHGERRPPLAPRMRNAAVQSVTLPDPEATLLVAGVLAAGPDLARRVERPEEFVPRPTALLSDLLTSTAAAALALVRPDVRLHDLPIPLVDNPTPHYPSALANAHVGGRVVVEFRIDSTGVVDLGTLHVVESTNLLFTDAVRGVLPQLHFVPAQIGEHPVGVTVRQPFLFTFRAGI